MIPRGMMQVFAEYSTALMKSGEVNSSHFTDYPVSSLIAACPYKEMAAKNRRRKLMILFMSVNV